MSISEISSSEVGFEDGEWGDSFGATSFAELAGSQREVTHLQEEYEIMNKILVLLYRKENHVCSLHGRCISHDRSATSSIRPLRGGSVEFELVYEWGDKEDTKVSGGISAEAHDDNGNYAKVEASRDSDGNNKVTVKAGIKEED